MYNLALINFVTKANPPENISINKNNTITTITWDDGGNPLGTEFLAENLSNGLNSGWSTSTSWSFPNLNCDTENQIQVKSRNLNFEISLAEIITVQGNECSNSGSSSSENGSSMNPFQTPSIETVTLSCNINPNKKYNFKEIDSFKIKNNSTVFTLNKNEIIFKDFTETQWGAQYLQAGLEYKIVEGYSNESFKPNQEVTAGEMAKILVKAAQIKYIEAPNDFELSNPNHWAKNYIYTLIKNDILGYPIDPEQKINRLEAISYVTQAYQLNNLNNSLPFSDIDGLNKVQISEIKSIYQRGIVSGYNQESNQILKPFQNISRIEALKISLLTNNSCF